MSIVDQLTIESLSAGLLSPSHLQSTQWCEVDGWCDGERQSRTRMRKTYGRFSMHLCPREIRKVATRKVVRVLRKVSLKQKLCSWLLFFLMREYKWRWERAWEFSLYLPRAECESACQRRLLTSKDKRERLHTCGQNPGGVRLPCQGLLYVLDK